MGIFSRQEPKLETTAREPEVHIPARIKDPKPNVHTNRNFYSEPDWLDTGERPQYTRFAIDSRDSFIVPRYGIDIVFREGFPEVPKKQILTEIYNALHGGGFGIMQSDIVPKKPRHGRIKKLVDFLTSNTEERPSSGSKDMGRDGIPKTEFGLIEAVERHHNISPDGIQISSREVLGSAALAAWNKIQDQFPNIYCQEIATVSLPRETRSIPLSKDETHASALPRRDVSDYYLVFDYNPIQS